MSGGMQIDGNEAEAFIRSMTEKINDMKKARSKLVQARDVPGWNDDNQKLFATDVELALIEISSAINAAEQAVGVARELVRKANAANYGRCR